MSAGNLGVLGRRRDNSASMYSSHDTSNLLGTIHSGSITTGDGSWPSWMYLVKARTSPSPGVILEKDGVMNWVTQSTMMYSSGESMHTINGGLSPTGKVTILYSIDLGVVAFQSSRREKMDSNFTSSGSGTAAATPAMVYLIAAIIFGGWQAWGAGWVRGGGSRISALAVWDIPSGHACAGCL